MFRVIAMLFCVPLQTAPPTKPPAPVTVQPSPQASPSAKPAAPKVELAVHPKLVTADVLGRVITATVVIHDIDESLWCPEVEWDWDGQKSSEESDCVPFEESEAGERAVWSQTASRRFFGSGNIKVTVRLLKAGKVLRTVEAYVDIVGQ